MKTGPNSTHTPHSVVGGVLWGGVLASG